MLPFYPERLKAGIVWEQATQEFLNAIEAIAQQNLDSSVSLDLFHIGMVIDAEWLQDETNAELRRRLIQQIGYERICQELDAIEIDNWREYTLFKIDGIERFYARRRVRNIQETMEYTQSYRCESCRCCFRRSMMLRVSMQWFLKMRNHWY